MNHVDYYKEIASKGSQKYKIVRGGGGGSLADQEMGPWWSFNSSIGGLCLQKLISNAPRNNNKHKFVDKYKKIASKSIGNYKKIWVGASADQEMGRWWSINSSIISPEINFKCSQKQPKTNIS